MNLKLSEVSEKIGQVIPSLQVEQVENGDKRNYRASFDKVHTRLGFRCERTIESGIVEISHAIETRQISDFTASRFNNHMVTQTFAASEPAGQSSMRNLAKLAA
jgi:hypothetical protein